MLAAMVIIFPAILAVLIYYRTYHKITPPHSKLAAYILFYTLSTNLIILSGLKLIGMHRFNLFAMGTGFKIKWLILELVLTPFIAYVSGNILTVNITRCKDIFRQVLPPALFCR